jgi:hypothetical protein
MGWSGRAPALTASEACKARTKDKEHAMSQEFNSAIAVVGIDMAEFVPRRWPQSGRCDCAAARQSATAIDGNAATEREETWQPIATSPMHPEYPRAHCIQTGSVTGVVKAALGSMDIPEIAMTSPMAPGVARRWTSMTVLTEEIANARVWAGFHYRFSTRVGTRMGLKIGDYVVRNVMQPVVTSSR